MDRDEFFEILRRRLLWETVCAHIERMNEADVILQKAGVENIAAECAEIQDTEDFFVMDVCESGGRIVIDFEMPFILCVKKGTHKELVQLNREYARMWNNYMRTTNWHIGNEVEVC